MSSTPTGVVQPKTTKPRKGHADFLCDKRTSRKVERTTLTQEEGNALLRKIDYIDL